MTKGKENFNLEDPSICAYLQIKGFKVIPQKLQNGKVSFLIEGNKINEALQELYSNPLVPVMDFIKTLKALRGSIFTLKGMR